MASTVSPERVRRAFERFAVAEAAVQGSPLYQRLCETVAADADILALAAEAGRGQPPPNLFLGAVHYLLAKQPASLAAYYPSLGGERAPDDALANALREFVRAHRDALAALLRTRLVQTNEVRRCTALLPAFRVASDEAGGSPLALIEVGPSAGLNLLFDRYAYDYSGTQGGEPSSPLLLRTEVREGSPPVERAPEVASRYGIDVNALDVRSAEDMRWLQALVWPEHHERREVLARAIEVAHAAPPQVVSGDVFEALPGAIADAPSDAAVVVFATFVLNQFSPEMLARLKALVLDASRTRPVRVVTMGANEWFGAWTPADGSTEVWLATAEDDRATARRLAVADPHGWWLAWRAGEPREWA